MNPSLAHALFTEKQSPARVVKYLGLGYSAERVAELMRFDVGIVRLAKRQCIDLHFLVEGKQKSSKR